MHTLQTKLIIFFLLALPMVHCGPKLIEENWNHIYEKQIDTSSGLFLREESGKNGKKIILLPDKSRVLVSSFTQASDDNLIDGREGNWVEARFQNKKGYIFDGFLVPYQAENCADQLIPEQYSGRWKCDNGSVFELSSSSKLPQAYSYNNPGLICSFVKTPYLKSDGNLLEGAVYRFVKKQEAVDLWFTDSLSGSGYSHGRPIYILTLELKQEELVIRKSGLEESSRNFICKK